MNGTLSRIARDVVTNRKARRRASTTMIGLALALAIAGPANGAVTSTAGGSGSTNVVPNPTYAYYLVGATLGIYPRVCADSNQPQDAGAEVWVMDTQVGTWKYWGFQSVTLNNGWNSTPDCWPLKYEAKPKPGIYKVYVRYWWSTTQGWRYLDENLGSWRV